MLPTPADVLAAAHRLRGIVVRTPLVRSAHLSSAVGTDVYFKCENLQKTGSFKFRGAYNALVTLSQDARERGVVASSAGNHGLGIALAAQMLGVRLLVFVPSTAPAVKRDGIRALGADVDQTQPHYDAAEVAARDYARTHEMTFVSPCAGEPLLAGQGTIANEILEELADVGTVVIPFGGGGLAAGIATLLRAASPATRIIGAQSERTNAVALSLAAGHIVEIDVPPTLVDGLSGQVDEMGFALGKFALDEVRVVTEQQVADAIQFIAREHDMKVEGAGAVSVATILSGNLSTPTGPVVLILSGANIDDEKWRRVVDAAWIPEL